MNVFKKAVLFLMSLFLFSVFGPAAGFCEEPGTLTSESPVEVTADFLSYDKPTNIYFARGNVVIVQDSTTIIADTAMLDMNSRVATAAGHVKGVDEGGNMLSGDTLQLFMSDKTLVITTARLFFKAQNVHIGGDALQKTGPQSYHLTKSTYTTCDCEEGETPAWDFYSSSANVNVGEFLVGKNAFFEIKGVPVFYSPVMVVPVKRERQTGFLIPKPGYSRLRGFVFDDAFFWAISRNTDATFYLDDEYVRGIGEGAEYRYIRTTKSFGEMFFEHFQENDINRIRQFRKSVDNFARPEDARNDRWQFKLKHSEVIDGFNIKANVTLVSDAEYYLDFGRGNERSLSNIESNVSVSKNWSGYSLVTQFRWFDNLLDATNASTIQMLPQVDFSGTDRKIYNTPFYLSHATQFMNFYSRKGVDGERLDLRPRLSLPLHPGGYFDITPSVGPRATFYYVQRDPIRDHFDRYIYDVTVNAVTTFVRVFQMDFNTLKAIQHTLRPGLVYTYIPNVKQMSLPQFDANDNVLPVSSFTYSLNTTLTGKFEENGAKRYYNYLYLDISQSYSINELTRHLTGPGDKRMPFSEITAQGTASPAEWWKLSGSGKYDVYMKHMNAYDTTTSFTDKRGDSLALSHRFVRVASAVTPVLIPGATTIASNNYLETSAKVRVAPAVDMTYINRFSLDENRSLETIYGMEYRNPCYTVLATLTRRPEENIIFFTFILRGLGKVAGISGGF